MIKVLVKKNQFRIDSIEVKGHANSDVIGKDLVCAGVSSILIGGINSIKNPSKFNIVVNEGYCLIEAKEKIDCHDEVVIETILTSLETVKESQSKFIEIKYI